MYCPPDEGSMTCKDIWYDGYECLYINTAHYTRRPIILCFDWHAPVGLQAWGESCTNFSPENIFYCLEEKLMIWHYANHFEAIYAKLHASRETVNLWTTIGSQVIMNCTRNDHVLYKVWRAVSVPSDQKQFNKGKFNGVLKPCYFSWGSQVLIGPFSAALFIFAARGHVIYKGQSRNNPPPRQDPASPSTTPLNHSNRFSLLTTQVFIKT